jgi:cell division protein FtsW
VNEKFGRMDIGVFVTSLLMLGFSIVLVYSSSFAVAQHKFGGGEFFLARQVVRAVLALACFMVFINVDYHFWGKHSRGAYVVAIVLLAYVLLMPSHAIHGAKRWITLGFIQFQASELALMVMVVLFAARLDVAGDDIRSPKQLAQYLLKIGLVCGLIILEPNFSTASIVGIIGLSLLFVAGARFWHLGGLFLVFVPVAAIVAASAPYRRHRIMAYLHMSSHKGDVGYQAFQSLVGLGNGGLFGVGLGQGGQKYFYLPEPHTDFIFSILGEEIGFVGLCAVLMIFGYMIYRGIKIAFNAPDKTGRLMAFGFTFILGIYVIVHACVNTGLIPTTGIPLPFLSYGGMSLIFFMSAMGVLLNISSQSTAGPLRLNDEKGLNRVSVPKRNTSAKDVM